MAAGDHCRMEAVLDALRNCCDAIESDIKVDVPPEYGFYGNEDSECSESWTLDVERSCDVVLLSPPTLFPDLAALIHANIDSTQEHEVHLPVLAAELVSDLVCTPIFNISSHGSIPEANRQGLPNKILQLALQHENSDILWNHVERVAASCGLQTIPEELRQEALLVEFWGERLRAIFDGPGVLSSELQGDLQRVSSELGAIQGCKWEQMKMTNAEEAQARARNRHSKHANAD
eukprot:TRINITY_DN1034_c0_g3_i1.p1 TRINITY_DN1034_c0_g3~~TRINITY_DN1034_c0_g3_i1.p1  ORF type:complete len:233 (-),score=63.09 TRINITY_DN1034_c0_g3_i1:48-746(-)